jgi:hypothetical protein
MAQHTMTHFQQQEHMKTTDYNCFSHTNIHIHTYIPGIHKFVKIKVGCGISYKHTKHTKYAVLKI